ncbi:hypothetical protein [Flavobacterium sp.]|uniref:hypothetical protein n=1 Tax=Flavobacterium sp. TaxID=239 RepID=UPI003BC45FFF
MNKFLSFFKKATPLLLLSISAGVEILAKVIESKFPTIAMGLQLLTFMVFIYTLIKFFNSKFK